MEIAPRNWEEAMKIEHAAASDRGKVRSINEDAYGFLEPSGERERNERGAIFIVADGMGGHRGGEIASKLAVESIIDHYYSSKERDPIGALREAFSHANSRIKEKSLSDVTLFGMGTTCTAISILRDKAFLGHVGDSRAYILRGGRLDRLTEDHSLVGEMVRSGMISDKDARNHPKRNVITRSLGTHDTIVPDIPSSPYELEDGDVLLLCSDGLTSLVSDEELREILRSCPPREATKALVNLANAQGGKDNITTQVIKVHSGNSR
jgi:serine/threonine protein phosphatase PrpC